MKEIDSKVNKYLALKTLCETRLLQNEIKKRENIGILDFDNSVAIISEKEKQSIESRLFAKQYVCDHPLVINTGKEAYYDMNTYSNCKCLICGLSLRWEGNIFSEENIIDLRSAQEELYKIRSTTLKSMIDEVLEELLQSEKSLDEIRIELQSYLLEKLKGRRRK